MIPRVLINNEITFQNLDVAVENGLKVDEELKHTNRKIPAFADDANGGLKRTEGNLRAVKDILHDFGVISGLETNVEKTTVMPGGCLNDPIQDGILNLGFEIVDSIKCLGLVINNRASDLESNFDTITEKIRKLTVHWGRFNLSLMGKISIAKTMMVSQIGYIGCIITPRPDQMAAMQNIIDRFVTGSIVIAEDRLYSKPKNGGLGLIDLKNYITALQCSWIKRCRQQINDPCCGILPPPVISGWRT